MTILYECYVTFLVEVEDTTETMTEADIINTARQKAVEVVKYLHDDQLHIEYEAYV
jgi:hypothetical protein